MGHWPVGEKLFERPEAAADGAELPAPTCTRGDVARAYGPVAVAAGAEVAGQLPFLLLEGARRTEHAALLLTVVVGAR